MVFQSSRTGKKISKFKTKQRVIYQNTSVHLARKIRRKNILHVIGDITL